MTLEPNAEDPPQIAEPIESYAFVTNVGRLTDGVSYVIAPGYELRRARSREIAFIKDTLRNLGPNPHIVFQTLWETPWPPSIGSSPPVLLPEHEARYFVIAYQGNNLVLH